MEERWGTRRQTANLIHGMLSDLERVDRTREAGAPSIIGDDSRSRRDHGNCVLDSLLEPSCPGMLELEVHNNPTLGSLRCWFRPTLESYNKHAFDVEEGTRIPDFPQTLRNRRSWPSRIHQQIRVIHDLTDGMFRGHSMMTGKWLYSSQPLSLSLVHWLDLDGSWFHLNYNTGVILSAVQELRWVIRAITSPLKQMVARGILPTTLVKVTRPPRLWSGRRVQWHSGWAANRWLGPDRHGRLVHWRASISECATFHEKLSI